MYTCALATQGRKPMAVPEVDLGYVAAVLPNATKVLPSIFGNQRLRIHSMHPLERGDRSSFRVANLRGLGTKRSLLFSPRICSSAKKTYLDERLHTRGDGTYPRY